MNNGSSLETAMGIGDGDDKFIAPGANITIMEKLYKVALGSMALKGHFFDRFFPRRLS